MLNFPNDPVVGETFPDPMIEGVPVWIWDGQKWRQAGTGSGGLDPDEFVLKAGDTMTGPLAIAPASADPELRLRKASTQAGVNAVRGYAEDLLRWALVMGDASPESGGNVGDNFQLQRYADDESPLGPALSASRGSGLITIPNRLHLPSQDNPSDANDAPNRTYVDNQIATRIGTSERATAAQIRAQQATWQAVYTTEGMRQALAFVERNASGAFYPDFPNWLNLRVNVQGNIAFQWPANDVSSLVGRSGLWWCVNYAAASYAFDLGSTYRYTFHNMQVPTNIVTGAGAWNLFGYSMFAGSRIHLTLLGSGMS